MAVQIDNLDSRVEVIPSTPASPGVGGGGRSAGPSIGEMDAQGREELKAFLRPIVMELFNEELQEYTRMRG